MLHYLSSLPYNRSRKTLGLKGGCCKWNTVSGEFHPFLITIAIGLTIMASYTGLDMFTLIKSSKKNKRLLYLGGSLSMGVGIWVMNFIGLIAADFNRFSSYHIPLTILSIVIGIAFSGIAFIPLFWKRDSNVSFVFRKFLFNFSCSCHSCNQHFCYESFH